MTCSGCLLQWRARGRAAGKRPGLCRPGQAHGGAGQGFLVGFGAARGSLNGGAVQGSPQRLGAWQAEGGAGRISLIRQQTCKATWDLIFLGSCSGCDSDKCKISKC